jgi:sugar lactone lactonase YvrE
VIRLPSNDVSRLVWAGNGSEVIGFAGHKLRYFDLAGKLQRTVTLPKHVELSSAISPDGRYMALNTALFDLTTGHTISLQLPRKQQMAPAPLGWLDDDHYAVDWPSSNGKTVEHRVLLFTNSGKLVKSITLPCGTSAMPGTGGKSTGVVMQLGYGADYPSNSGLRL